MRKKALLFLMALSIAATMVFTGCEVKKDDSSSKKDKATSSVDSKDDSSSTKDKDSSKDDSKTDKKTTAKAYAKGTLTATTFESEYLNLKFTLPEGYKMATKDEMIKMSDLGADIAGVDKESYDYSKARTVYEMMASGPNKTPNVFVYEEKLPLASMKADQYIEAVKNQLSAVTALKYTFEDGTQTISFAGQEYTAFTATAQTNGKTVTQDYCVRIQGDRAIAIVVSYLDSDSAEVQKLMDSFAPLH